MKIHFAFFERRVNLIKYCGSRLRNENHPNYILTIHLSMLSNIVRSFLDTKQTIKLSLKPKLLWKYYMLRQMWNIF